MAVGGQRVDRSPGRRDQLRERDGFLETGVASPQVRGVVADSWLRSAAAGVDPESSLAPVRLGRGDLAEYRSAHPLARVFPLLHDVLGRTAEDCDCVLAVGDAQGQLLWVCGTPGMLALAGAINFVEGSVWDEPHAGTNAPGMALALDEAVQVHSAEHYTRLVQPWSCAAAPIHDPATQEILGLVDITGGDDVASPQTLGMVRAAARMAEAELARLAAVAGAARPDRAAPGGRGGWSPGDRARPLLAVHGLGRPECLAEIDGRSHRLSPRHSEILVVLVEHPEGRSAEQIAVEVYPGDVQSSTMRAEMARLRRLLGPGVLQSRPYRLTAPTVADWQGVTACLGAGRVGDALHAYRGPLLPRSEAPGIVERRETLQRQLRAAVLGSERPELLVAWTRSWWGAEDVAVWRRQAQVLPPRSPLRPLAAAETRRLERELTARRSGALTAPPRGGSARPRWRPGSPTR